jgi:hypothetical protein
VENKGIILNVITTSERLGSQSIAIMAEARKELNKLRSFKNSDQFTLLPQDYQNYIGQLITAQEMVIKAHQNVELLTYPNRAQTYK